MSPVPAPVSSNQNEDHDPTLPDAPFSRGETAEITSPPPIAPQQSPPRFAAAQSPSQSPLWRPPAVTPGAHAAGVTADADRISAVGSAAPRTTGSVAQSQPTAQPTSPPVMTGAPAPIPSSVQERRRSPFLIAAATFALGGIVGAGGFGLGQYFAEDGSAVSNPVVNVASPSNETTPGATPESSVVPIPNAAPSPLGAEPAADVARILGPSVVQVETNIGQGSGVVYADGLILTNHHVIDSASQVRIRTSDGRVFETEVLGSDARNDIAVLSAPGSDLPVATIGSSAALEPGQTTVAIGSPFQLQQTVTAGIVSSVNRPVPNAGGGFSAMIQTDAPINPGNSGGALANRNGELVGINASIRTDGTGNSNVGIGFAVPIDTAIQVAERIVSGDSLERGVLGVTGDTQDSDVGVPVAEVTPGSGADIGGIEAGDRILTIDGAPVTNIRELTGLVQSNFSGDMVELEVQRGSTSMTLEATLS